LSRPRIAGLTVGLVATVAVFGTAAVILAGITTFAMRASSALPADSAEPQTPNRAIKAGRIAGLVPAALNSGDQAGLMLASAPQSADLESLYNFVTTAQPMGAAASSQATASAMTGAEPTAYAPATQRPQAVAALPTAPEKPKRGASPASQTNNMLDDGAIAGLKTRLRLTPDQMELWPAVESALREVGRTQLRHTKAQMQSGRVSIDVNSAEVQQLIWAAMPLLMRLREDQKNEVRKLARIIGLEQVASQI